MKEQEPNSLEKYCAYCKDEIFDDENYIVVKGLYYHVFCWKQRNTIQDPFEDDTY
jgi:hypothetical protein